MKRIILALLTLSFSNNLFAYDYYEDTFYCPKKLVVFWEEFAAIYGESTIPQFLVLNNCIDTSEELQKLYRAQRKLIQQFASHYIGGNDSYSNQYFLNSHYQPENTKNSELINKDKESHNAQNVQNNRLINTVSANIDNNKTELLETAHQNNETKEPENNLLIIVIENTTINLLLVLIISLIAIITLVKYFKRPRKQTSPKQCPDCHAIIKPNKKQCFICGSYV